MKSAADEFLLQSPTKILERAEIYSKTLDNYFQLPKEASKSLVVRSIAQNQKEDIEYAIQMSQYQQQLFQNKEQVDQRERQRYRKLIELKEQKVNNNITQIEKNHQKKNQDYEKHLKLVHDRYLDEENRHRTNEKEKSYQIRNGLLEFFEKEHKRKQQAERRQASVGGCYQDAVERINSIHKKNEQYAKTAEMSLGRDLAKNSKYGEIIFKKRRALTQNNKRKDRVYRQSLSILNDREKQFIQTCGKNEDGFLKAWEKIGNTITDFRKKRNEDAKKQLDRWKSNKQRIDESQSQIPERCVNILDKTSRASFRQTATSFRSSASKYEEIVQHNKDAIKEEDEKKKDQIMSLHLDLRLRNTASWKITQKMHSMRHHAKKIAYDCL